VKLRSHSRPLLGLRLGAIACILAVPVAALALNENLKIDREIVQFKREKAAVHWIALADNLVNDIETAETGSGPGLSSAARARIDGKLRYLGRFSDDVAATIPSTPQAFAQIDRAWRAEATAPSGVALAQLATEGGSALDSVSDSSQLSFESHVFIADLGDALDNSYYRVFSPLGAAAETMQAGSLSFGERIQIAGGVALARQFKHELSTIFSRPSTRRQARPLRLRCVGMQRSMRQARSRVTSLQRSKNLMAALRRRCCAASGSGSPHEPPLS